jgi:hypothetical protein
MRRFVWLGRPVAGIVSAGALAGAVAAMVFTTPASAADLGAEPYAPPAAAYAPPPPASVYRPVPYVAYAPVPYYRPYPYYWRPYWRPYAWRPYWYGRRWGW